MRKSLNSGIVKFGIAVLALSLNLFAACEIGLGSAVDTEVPQIDFAETTVASGAVVRDSFAVFGTFDDDGSISSLGATLTNLETGYCVEKDGEINLEDKTWTVVYDPKEDSIPDATYELSIVIKDSVDHESKISRSIIIDNTAPLVVLTRPSTKKGAVNFDSYGQSFTLEGKAADDNDVSLIEVAVYDNADCTGSPLKTISLPNVPLTIESDVATYAANTVNDYSVIYGHVDTSGFVIRDNTDAIRYCKVIVYDGAQRYPADGSAQTDADKKGNSVNYYYLNSDLAELFTAGYKITELYHILNGTYQGSSRSVGTSSVISMLNNVEKQTGIGQFKLNPENSPHFVVSSRNIVNYATDTLEDQHGMTNGNSFIEVELTPGLDGHIIREETVGVYLVQCRLKTAAEAAATGPGLVYLNGATVVANESQAKVVWLIPVDQHAQTADITQSGSTYKFKTKNAISTSNFTNLGIGESYAIKVTGLDMQGNRIISEGDYCFYLSTSGNNIDITSALLSPSWISTNSSAASANRNPSIILKYSPETQYTTENPNQTHPGKPFEIWRGLGNTTSELVDVTDLCDTIIESSPQQAQTTDSSIISGLGITQTNHPATVYYKIKGMNSAETITAKPVSLLYDDDNPTVSIPAADLPGTSAGEQDSITLRGNASDADSGIQKVYVQIYDKDHTSETTPAAPAVGATAASTILTATYSGGTWVLPVSPAEHDGGTNEDSAFVREGKKVIIVTVEDAVGLRAISAASAGEFIYDKTKPTGTITGTVPSISSSILNISGTAADGWGVAKVEIEQKKKNSSGAFVNPIKRTVWEEASNATTPSPSVTWSTANTTGLTLPFSSSTASYEQTEMDGSGHPADGEYEYTIIITDKAGKKNQTTISKQISFYSVAPEITFTQPAGAFALTNSDTTTPWQRTSNNITISGTASVNSGATITGVYYKYDPATAPTEFTGPSGWTFAGQSTWSISQEIADSSAAHNLYVVAVDNANKKSLIEHRVIKVDTTAPTTTANYYKIDTSTDLNAVSGTVYVKDGTSLTVYGKYEDTASGVKELTLKLDGNTLPTGLLSSLEYSTSELTISGGTAVPTNYGAYSDASATSYKSWKAVFNFSSSFTGELITAEGENYAGKKTTATVIDVRVDTTAPTVTITSPSTNSFVGATDLSISGTASDGNGSGLSSDAFEVYYTKSSSLGGTTPASITAGTNASSAWVSLGTVTSGSTWTKTLEQSDIASLSTNDDNTALWFTVKVKDKAGSGNIRYAVPVKVTVDRKIPAYTESSTLIGGKNTTQLASSPWFSSSTLVVSGAYTDAGGSGVDTIYYQLGNATPVPLPTTDGTFNTNISGFTSAAAGTVLKLKAKDKVGNQTAESSYTIKVDTTAPITTANCYKKDSGTAFNVATGTVYVKAGSSLTFYGKYEDDASGVNPLSFKLDNVEITPTSLGYSTGVLTFNSSNVVTAVPADTAFVTYNANNATSYKTWKAVFNFTSTSTGGRLTAEGSNTAGLPATVTVIDVQVDTDAPTVTITSPAANAKIAATNLAISGNASDGTGSGLSSDAFTVYYTKSSSLGGVTSAPTSLTKGTATEATTKWVSLGTTASNATWNFTQASIESITTASANTDLWFTVEAKDKAGTGNYGYAVPVKVTVDRNLPVYDPSETRIGGKLISELESNPWFSSSTLVVSGAYSDDCSGVDKIIYQLGSGTAVELPTDDGTFNTNISGFVSGATGNVLKLKAKDKVGNITSESSYTVKVDTSTTTLSANCYKKGSAATLYPATGTAYLGNTTTAITVYGKYANNVSGVEQLTFKYGDAALTPTSVTYSTGELTFNSSNVVTAVPADTAFVTYNANNATSYKTWKAVFTPTANGRLTVEGSNKAGTPVSATAFEVTIDTEDPALENLKLKETTGSGTSAVTKDAYIRESNSTYYVNNSATAGKTFKVTGVATDNYGVEKVSFSVVRWENGSAASNTPPLTVADITNPSGAWEKPITGWSDWTDSAKITVTATDKAGHTATSTIDISFDTDAPKPMHWADAKNKDIYFRIGNADNDKTDDTHWETGDAVGDGTSATDVANSDVGSKYSYGSWGSDSSIEIRGTFEEASTGSGIKTIYYAIFDNATALTNNLTAFTNGTLSADATNHIIKVGSFAPLDTAVTKNVPYNKDSSGNKDKKEISTNFRTTLSGFNAEENFLVLLAEDYAGNRALDELKVTEGTTNGLNNGTAITGTNTWNSSKAYYGIKKDSQTPNIATSVTTGLYTNGAGNALTISGTASDAASHLKNVVVTIEEIGFSEEYRNFIDDASTQNWSVTVPASAFANINSGSYTVYAEATDNAGSGNKKKISAATIYVDKTPPTVTINSPVEDAKVGAAFTISGTARDGTGAGVNTAATAKPVLYYTTSSDVGASAPTTSTIGTNAASSWKSYGNPTLANEQDWSLDVDLSAIVSANANTPVYLSVSATDKSGSGNTGYSSPLPIIVDRKAPAKSSFNIGETAGSNFNTTSTTTWFNSNTLDLNGEFTDDNTSTPSGSGVAAILYKLDTGTEQEIPSTGNFSRPVAGFTDSTTTNPYHTLQVRAKDAVGNYSAYETYYVKVDTARPVISAVADHPFTDIVLTNGSAARTFYFDALDTGSGIAVSPDSVTVQISNSNNETTNITNGVHGSSITVGAANATTGKHLVTVVLGAADLATLSGSNSVLVSVSDTAGNQSNLQSIGTLNVDTNAPVPAFTSHNHTATVNKQIILSGTVTDASNSAITAMSLTATCGSTTKVYGYPTGTDGNITYSNGQWSYTLDTTVFNNTTTAANMTLTLTATDAAGNTGSAEPPVSTDPTTPMTLSIDQNSDRPVVKFTNLVREGEGTNESPYKYILKYGNEAKLEGSISDDDSTASAVVTTFIASSTPITSATATPSGETEFNAATGEFSFKPADTEDGLKTVYFYVVDNKGNAFYTTQTTQLTRPYQQYKTAAKEDNAAAFNYSSDSNAPTINSVQLQAYTAASGGTTSGSATTLGASCIVGGENKKFVTLSVSAKDGNGIKGIVIELEQATGASTSVIKRYRSNTTVSTGTFEASGSVTATENINQNHVYTTDRLDLETLGFTQDADSSVNDIKDGKVTVRVYVYDNSGLYSNQESLFVIDNTAPELNITTPAENGEQVYAIQSNTVGGSVDGHTDVETIYYAVTTTATAPTTNATGVSTAGWHEIPNAKLSASVIFDGVGVGTSSTEGYHSNALRAWIKTLNNQSDDDLNEHDDRITVYVHFKVVDKCGNAGITTRNVSAYPNGDKPVIELVYPENKAGGAIPSLAGTIRIYGYASVAIGTVTATYIQIDPSFVVNDGFNEDGWETELDTVTAANYTVEDIGTSGLRGIKANGTQNWNLPINGNNEFNPTGTDESRHMAIRVYSLSDSGKVSEPFLQKFDVDPNAPHIGGDGTKDALEDTTARQYSLQIVDFAGDVTAAKTITNYANPVSYKPDMWVKGQKYLIASVYDDSGIKALTLNENINGVQKINLVSFERTGENQEVTIHDGATLNPLNGGGRITVTQSPCGYTGKRNINIVIPLPTNSGSGSINWQLEATEDGDNNNNCISTIKLNYDNAAPKLGMTDHAKYSIDADIHQSNGFYTFKGYATDAEGDSSVSGMRSVAFYFMRRGTAATNPVTKVYDPMLQNNSVAVRTGSTDANGIIYSHGLYWKQKTNVERDTSDLKKFTLSTADSNVHPGGLALVGGSIYRIESVSGTTVMLDEDIPTSQTTVSFALALVVDNLTKKETTTGRTIQTAAGYGHGYYTALASADDGDRMQEDWDGTSIEGQWTAIINSANIPDGPIELHYVAFDKAQNYAVGIVGNVAKATYEAYATKDAVENKAITGATTDTTNKLATKYYYTYDSNKPAYISNNAPRIAGVTVGTDYNGDGSITDGSVVSGVATLNEKKSKYSGEADRYIGGTSASNIQKKATGDQLAKIFLASANETTPMMVIKDRMSVDIEIIGGNGNLYYRYKVGTGDWNNGASAWVAGTDYTRTTNEGLTGTDAFGQSYYNTTAMPTLNFTETDIKNKTSADGTVLWTFEIWDSTEERTHFVDSQNTTLKLPLDIQVRDGLRPNTVVSDLYWNSATDNSVYIDANGKHHGHVELIKDLTGTSLGSTYGTTDDKVSGVVVFRGFAYDNKRLSQIDWAIVNSTGNSILPNNTSGITYQTGPAFTNGAWSNGGTTGDLAYNASTKKVTGTYKFTIKTAAADGAYLDEKGHKVAWELAVDTSKINGVVAKDAKLYVRAKDTSGSATTQYTDMTATGSPAQGVTDQEAIDKATKKPTYQVDILPYITNVKTWLSKKNKSNPTVYSRTAKGHYPIASSETADDSVMLQGYNLASGNADVDISGIIGTRTTGPYAYTVSGTGTNAITTINNMNNNDAHGDYDITDTELEEKTKVANMYNRQPNTSTNLTLTDDIYFDMWDFKKAASPINGNLNEPVMRINPTNGAIGFGFANGADSLSLPNGTKRTNNNAAYSNTGNYRFDSYQTWQGNYANYSGINFVYDSNGYVHSVSTGLDTNPSSNIAGYMQYIYSTWQSSGTEYGNWQGARTAALESVAIPSGIYLGNTALTSNLYDLKRFGKPAIGVSTPRGTNSDNPTVYIAYYDADNNHIRFRYGTVTPTKTGRTNAYNQLSDDKANQNGSEKTIGSGGATSWDNHHMFEAHPDYYSVLAGKTQKQSAADSQVDTENGTSPYVALDVISGSTVNDDIVVIVWYDGSDLMYTYRYGTKDDTDCTSNGYPDRWATPQVIFEGIGQYCTIKADAQGGIHIAAYSRSDADLYYAYMPAYNEYDNLQTALVDSYSQVGKYISIDAALVLREGSTNQYNVVPYISYYGDGFNGLPKVAYLPGGINKDNPDVPNGSDNDTDTFTGGWEVTLLPTSSEVNEDNMNIGLWKNSTTGVLTTSPRPANTTDPNITAAGTNTATWYGNGTSKFVVGYGITYSATGFIEIGQLKN